MVITLAAVAGLLGAVHRSWNWSRPPWRPTSDDPVGDAYRRRRERRRLQPGWGPSAGRRNPRDSYGFEVYWF